MPSQLLEAVRIGGDAIRVGALREAFAILGPDGDGFVDFEYVERRGPQAAKPYGRRWDWQTRYIEDYDEVDEAIIAERTAIRMRLKQAAAAEWRSPPKRLDLQSMNAVLKELYPPTAVTNMAKQPTPFASLLRAK